MIWFLIAVKDVEGSLCSVDRSTSPSLALGLMGMVDMVMVVMVNDHIGHDEKLDAADTRSYLSPSSFTFSNKLLKGDESIMVLETKPVQVFVKK